MRASLRLAQIIRTASLPLYHSCTTASPSRDREGTVVMETVRFDDEECASASENIETVMRAVCRDPDTLRTSPGKPRFSPLRGRGHPCISTLYIYFSLLGRYGFIIYSVIVAVSNYIRPAARAQVTRETTVLESTCSPRSHFAHRSTPRSIHGPYVRSVGVRLASVTYVTLDVT